MKAASALVDDAGDDRYLDLPVASLHRITAADLGDGAGCVLVRLPGVNEYAGTPRYRFVPCRRAHLHHAEYPSMMFMKQKTEEVNLADLGRTMQKVILQILNDPPDDHLKHRACRRVSVPLRGLSDPDRRLDLADCPFPPSRLLCDIIHLNPKSPALSLDRRHYVFRAIERWGLPSSGDTACVIYGSVSSALCRFHRRSRPLLSNAALMELVCLPCQ